MIFSTFEQQFNAIQVLDKELVPARFVVQMDLLVNVDFSSNDLKFTLHKLDFWFDKLVNNSIILSIQNEWAIDTFLDIDKTFNLPFLTPYDPMEDLLAVILQNKCSALAKNVFDIKHLTIKELSSPMSYTYSTEYPINLPQGKEWFQGPSFYKDPWWHRDDSSTFDFVAKTEEEAKQPSDLFFSLDFLKQTIYNDGLGGEAEIIRPNFKPKIVK